MVFQELKINISEQGNEVKIDFKITDNSVIEKLSFKLPTHPKKVIYGEKAQILENDAGIFLVLGSVRNGDEITLKF